VPDERTTTVASGVGTYRRRVAGPRMVAGVRRSLVSAVGLVVGAFALWVGHTIHSDEHLLAESSAICGRYGFGDVGGPIPVKVAVARLRATPRSSGS
jgi:hypothetical protein